MSGHNQSQSKRGWGALLVILGAFLALFAFFWMRGGEVERPDREEPWSRQPMPQLTVVTLLLEKIDDGGMAHSLGRFIPQIRDELNIDLQIVEVPWKDKYGIQLKDLSAGKGSYDIHMFWPCYLPVFSAYLEELQNIPPGGIEQVRADLELADQHPAYGWTVSFDDKLYGTQIDGDVKLLNYRYDLANDPKEREAFRLRYGYELDMNRLTWEKYHDVAEFFTRPEKGLYGTAEAATFLSYYFFRDRFVGMGGHFFSYDDMTPFPDREKALQALRHGLTTFQKYSPPDAEQFGAGEVLEQLYVRQAVFMAPYWPNCWRLAARTASATDSARFAVARMPGFQSGEEIVFRPDMNGGRVMVIDKNSQAREAAYKVLVFFSRKIVTQQFVRDSSSWADPWRKSHMEPALFSDYYPQQPELRQIYVDVLEKSTVDGYPALQIAGVHEYMTVIEKWVTRTWQGDVKPEDALEQMASELDGITDRHGREKQLKQWQGYVDTVLKPVPMYP